MSMSKSQLAYVTTVAVATVAIVAALRMIYAPPPAAPVSAAPALPAGVIRLAPGDPQLSSIGVVAVASTALPASEPIAARIAYDESATSRVVSPVSGRVAALLRDVGDVVAAGSVLAEIDAPDLGTAEADLQKAIADESHKQRSYKRAKELFEGDVLARKDLEIAEADLAQAAAETRRARQRMRSLNASGSENGRLRLRAPVTGTVSERTVNPGQEVRPDLPAPLFVVSNIDRLWVIVDLPERAMDGVAAGQRVTVEADALPNQRFNGVVQRVSPALDPSTRRIQVRCAIDNPKHQLRPEMFARVTFLTVYGARRAIPVQNTGLFVEGLDSFVFLAQRPGEFVKRRVHVALRGRERSYVDAGLADGDKIVAEGAFLLNAEAGTNAQ